MILEWSTAIGMFMVGISMLLSFIRLIIGPRFQDRILAFDSLSTCVIMMALLISIRAGHPHNLPVLFILSMLTFVASAAFSKFLMRGEVIE